MKMFLISDNVDTYTGMRLAGVEGVVVHGETELRAAIGQVLQDKEVGIVLLTERFGRECPGVLSEIREKYRVPLFVEIPDRHGTGRSRNFITDYVNQAIGLKL